ncbi:response regulator [Cohnella boryungensis]|uniref:Response regulator n=1 Tax=Cohnella boryungensis TaxID=768479 RepID=A0ABV8SEE2_9BACL
MNAILIDDEPLALMQMERLVEQDQRIRIVGKFTSAQEGIAFLSEEPVPIVFLDIGMPGMNGLEAADAIQQLGRDILIVYITANSEYAIEAFELYALDYLLKPVSFARFVKTVDRIEKVRRTMGRAPQTPVADNPQVMLFKRLSLSEGISAGNKQKWRTLKAQELFAYLVAQQGQWIPKERMLEELWPDYEYDRAIPHLHTAISQIRKILKGWGVEAKVEFALDSYRLKWQGLETDVDLMEREAVGAEIVTEEQFKHALSLIALYRGDYLEEHDFRWAEARRVDLKLRYQSLVLQAAKYELKGGSPERAFKRLLELQEKEPYSDEICRAILQACADAQDLSAVRLHYEAFAARLMEEVSADPEPRTIGLYKSLTGARE